MKSRHLKYNHFWISAAAVLILDQAVKFMISWKQPSAPFISYVQNTGAGFGILQGRTAWLALVSLVVAIAVMFYYPKLPKDKAPQILWGLFLGGVLGNLTDRVFRGFVIDFIDLGFWPAFNVADAALTISVIGLVWWYWKK